MKQSNDSLTSNEGANASGNLSQRPSQVSCLDYRVVIEPDENGVFVARCPALLGCSSHGKTPAEALANIKEAMTEHLASLTEQDKPAPPTLLKERR
jgi:predicted RNase H-like HicB family nuclease